MAVSQNELLTPLEAATALNIKLSTIRAWILGKKIPYVKIGGKLVRFRRADIDRFIAVSVVPAKAGARG
jgi:excisionase family DNA binding protein